MGDLSKFQSLCEEVIDLDHLRKSAGRQVRVRPSFHEELERLGQELDRAQNDMVQVLKDVEKESKVRGASTALSHSCPRADILAHYDRGTIGPSSVDRFPGTPLCRPHGVTESACLWFSGITRAFIPASKREQLSDNETAFTPDCVEVPVKGVHDVCSRLLMLNPFDG